MAVCVVATSALQAAQRNDVASRQRHIVQVEGHPVVVWGRVPEQPAAAVLLVHGRTWSARPGFDLQVPGLDRSVLASLASRGVAAYAVDLRGYGETPLDPSGALTPQRAAADISAVLGWIASRHPALPAPVLVGWSRGGAIALLAARDARLRVAGLVVYGFAFEPGARFGDAAAARPGRPAANTADAVRSDFVSPDVAEPALVRAFVEQALAADPFQAPVAGEAQFNLIDPARIRVPVLFLYGRRDPTIVAGQAERLAARIRSSGTPSDVVVLDGGDHAAHLEATHEAWIDAVVRFVRHVSRPAGFR